MSCDFALEGRRGLTREVEAKRERESMVGGVWEGGWGERVLVHPK